MTPPACSTCSGPGRTPSLQWIATVSPYLNGADGFSLSTGYGPYGEEGTWIVLDDGGDTTAVVGNPVPMLRLIRVHPPTMGRGKKLQGPTTTHPGLRPRRSREFPLIWCGSNSMKTEKQQERYIKIGDDGALLAGDATEWVAVLDTRTNLMWAVEVLPARQTWKKALKAPEKLTTGGFKDWRLPTVEELVLSRRPHAI